MYSLIKLVCSFKLTLGCCKSVCHEHVVKTLCFKIVEKLPEQSNDFICFYTISLGHYLFVGDTRWHLFILWTINPKKSRHFVELNHILPTCFSRRDQSRMHFVATVSSRQGCCKGVHLLGSPLSLSLEQCAGGNNLIWSWSCEIFQFQPWVFCQVAWYWTSDVTPSK